MKKALILILSVAIMLLPCGVFANSEQMIHVYVNGTGVELNIQTELVNGVCMVPLMELSGKICGSRAKVFMDPYTYVYDGTLSYGDSFTTVKVGTNEAFSKNFGPIKIDAAPYLNRGDLMVPLTMFNVLADQGVYVSYDYVEHRIEITTANVLGQPSF